MSNYITNSSTNHTHLQLLCPHQEHILKYSAALFNPPPWDWVYQAYVIEQNKFRFTVKVDLQASFPFKVKCNTNCHLRASPGHV